MSNTVVSPIDCVNDGLPEKLVTFVANEQIYPYKLPAGADKPASEALLQTDEWLQGKRLPCNPATQSRL